MQFVVLSRHSALTVPMAGKPHGESIADDVISSPTAAAVPDTQLIRNDLDDIVSRVSALEIMVMRILDAIELSYNVNHFGGNERE